VRNGTRTHTERRLERRLWRPTRVQPRRLSELPEVAAVRRAALAERVRSQRLNASPRCHQYERQRHFLFQLTSRLTNACTENSCRNGFAIKHAFDRRRDRQTCMTTVIHNSTHLSTVYSFNIYQHTCDHFHGLHNNFDMRCLS